MLGLDVYTEYPYIGMVSAPVDFEWDDAKAAGNLGKHGVSFGYGTRVFLDPNRIVIETFRPQDGEDRLKVVGRIENRVFTVVCVMHGTVCRVISVRRSNSGEEKAYGDR
ncbi:MAG TPA: BrnT family toxin [Stellaceae bacterium]|nr:BrnT family toxin [Stellaceae bacterium]